MLPDLMKLTRLSFASICARLALLFTASYGLLYYSYKYLLPSLGIGDSEYYYPMYQAPLNFHVAQSPFVLRQVGAILTYLVWRCHLYYPNAIAFNDPGYDQHIFFASLLVNWICLVLTAFTVGVITEHLLGRRDLLLSTLAAFLCLFSFHAQSAVITDVAEGPAWLLLALAFWALVRRSYLWLIPVLVVSILEREMVLVATAFLSAMELFPWRSKNRFALKAMVVACAGFVVYVVLRRSFAGDWEFQTHPGSFLQGLIEAKATPDFIFRSLLAQNILFIAIAAFFVARRGPAVVGYWLPKLMATFVFLVLVGIGSFVGDNVGRVAGILTPAFAVLAALSLGALQHPQEGAPAAPADRTNLLSFAFLAGAVLLIPCLVGFRHFHPRPAKPHRVVEKLRVD